ncbi:MAG: excisionase family DNA-binding protein [Elusimicrobiota bacterium]
MNERFLSTGQAAKICSVTRDTVLKWIKLGKIDAIQTPGGHYRVNRISLDPYLSSDKPVAALQPADKHVSFCWEYHAKEGEIGHDCRKCMVFKSQAQKCYLMAGLGEKGGHVGVHCKDNCYECEYFRFINDSVPNVLLITDNEDMIKRMQARTLDRMILRVASCEYDTSAMVHDFKPDFIIIDDSLIGGSPDGLCRHLIKDPRVHGAQIILAVPEGRKRDTLLEGVCASMVMPFSVDQMEESFDRLRRSLWGTRRPPAQN